MTTAKVKVHLDGSSYDLECEDDQTLLEAMQRVDIDVPTTCKEGECGTCRCHLETGTANLRRNKVLDAKELADGWILACQAEPTATSLTVRFPDD